MRIAAPVCALVRNDMLKEEACARVQGRLVRKVRRNLPGVSGCKGLPHCHCYENKVGTFRKRAQEIDPEPGRFFRLDYAQAIADVGGLPA